MVEGSEGSAGEPSGHNRPEPIQITADVARVLSLYDAERDAGRVTPLSRQKVSDLFAKLRSDIRKSLELLG